MYRHPSLALRTEHVVARGYKTLGRTLRHNGKYRIKFNMKRVKYYGKPTGCRAYVRWYA